MTRRARFKTAQDIAVQMWEEGEVSNVTRVSRSTKVIRGVRTSQPCITFGVTKKNEAQGWEMFAPKEIEGVFTDVVEVPVAKALYLLPMSKRFYEFNERLRPCPSGMSVGEETITAGTLGAWVLRDGDDHPYGLSNNHVLAAINEAVEGANILQPGSYDGGKNPADIIGHLSHYVHINFDNAPPPPPGGGGFFGCVIGRIANGESFWTAIYKCLLGIENLTVHEGAFGSNGNSEVTLSLDLNALIAAKVNGELDSRFNDLFEMNLDSAAPFEVIEQELNEVDAALFKVADPDFVLPESRTIGDVNGFADPVIGTLLIKDGRTTERTSGKVIETNAVVDVDYGDGYGVTRFYEQLVSDIPSAGGDSGSGVFDMENRLAGLLFAGGGGETIMNLPSKVVGKLGISIP